MLGDDFQKLIGGSNCPFKQSTVIEAGEFSYLSAMTCFSSVHWRVYSLEAGEFSLLRAATCFSLLSDVCV